MENRFFVASPSFMEGLNCYTDAATAPDHMSNGITSAGLGIYILNSQTQPSVTVSFKAVLRDSQSVFAAEAAALAFATLLLHFMQMDQVNYFTDNQLLAHYLNNVDRFDIPDWRAAAYTHIINSSLTCASKVFHISRTHNGMADSLAKEGLHLLNSDSLLPNFSCTNPTHVLGCPFLGALQSVTVNSVMVITTSCFLS
jgi:ribonuclease HI